MRPKHTEAAIVEGEPADIGRDPREMTREEMAELGHHPRPILDAIRANCIECCGGNSAEVRRCRMVACNLWPFRMATNPLREPRVLSDEERERLKTRMLDAQAKMRRNQQTEKSGTAPPSRQE